jgi:hypothetical protein
MYVMSLLAVSEAAERLGVSTRQVQHLGARREMRSLARGVVASPDGAAAGIHAGIGAVRPTNDVDMSFTSRPPR